MSEPAKTTSPSKMQLVISVTAALGLVAFGGSIINNGERGIAFFVWLASAMLIAVAVVIRIRVQVRPSSPRAEADQAAREFRVATFVAGIAVVTGLSDGILSVQSNRPVWGSVVQLLGGVGLGVWAFERRRRRQQLRQREAGRDGIPIS